MERYLVASLAVILTITIGGFCAYVALLPLLAVSFVLLGMALTFFLGVYFAMEGPARFSLSRVFHWFARMMRRYRIQTLHGAR